jgi:hypothetical protein
MAEPTNTPAPASAGSTSAPAAAATPTPAFDPKGKSFSQRLDAFREDVQKNYKIIVTRDAGRTAEWQQKHHVAHMFAYNKYQSTVPKNTETGGRTIAWSHFSDPKVQWSTVDWTDFLRTKTDGTPTKGGDGWTKGQEPDKDKTTEHVKQMLRDAGIGNSGQAMVSSGLNPCAEPCGCGAGRSNHLSDLAADLGLVELQNTLAKLPADKKTTLDDYLKGFGLHRPLKDHPESPEEWHVESISNTAS